MLQLRPGVTKFINKYLLKGWILPHSLKFTSKTKQQEALLSSAFTAHWQWKAKSRERQYSGHLVQSPITGEDLMLRKTEGRKRTGDRGGDSWMASPTRRTRVSANSGRQWRIGKPGAPVIGSQRAGYNWATEQQQRVGNGFLAVLSSKNLSTNKSQQKDFFKGTGDGRVSHL